MTRLSIERIFADKIKEVYRFDTQGAERNARRILARLPDRLTPNIYEWIRGEPLSDIYIQDYSVPKIMAIGNSKDFLRAVQIMIELEENPDRAVRQIWNMRR